MKDALICLAAGKSQIPIIMAAKSLGYIVIAVDMDPNAPGFSHVDGCVMHSTHDASGVIKALESLNHQISEKYRWIEVLVHQLLQYRRFVNILVSLEFP